jgi:hypothetical protein
LEQADRVERAPDVLVYVRFLEILAADLDFAFGLAGLGEGVGHLHREPGVLRAAEGLGEADGHPGADAGLAGDDIVEGLAADSQDFCTLCDLQPERLQAIVQDDAAVMDRIFHGHGILLAFVIIDQFNVKGIRSFK